MADAQKVIPIQDVDPVETQDWLESIEYVLEQYGPERVSYLLNQVKDWAALQGVRNPINARTPYTNTILPEQEVPFPGDREMERKLKSMMRWNAVAMVVQGNKSSEGIGGHIATYASIATLFEVGFNHFFKLKTEDRAGDQVFYQAHACPGIYARAFLEGRLSEQHLRNFRRELAPEGGLSSYPHPWLMPDFWEYPSVSMGLAPIMAIYQARFNKYLENRGIKDTSDSHVWVFGGDGETDEPETLGAIRYAGREKLDNLTFTINCNLQRLDGPVCGNAKIIQELEGSFRGADWNVIKVVWSAQWDDLLSNDDEGLLVKRMTEVVDGEYQKYKTMPGSYVRENFFGTDPRLLAMVAHLSDDEVKRLGWGGNDPHKVYNAYHAAKAHKGQPTVILMKTVKGYGLGDAGEAMNIAHQQKKMTEEQLITFRDRFRIPISDEQAKNAEFFRPEEGSPELKYLKKQRDALGGAMPQRSVAATPLKTPDLDVFSDLLEGTGDRAISTTMAYVRALSALLKDKEIGKRIVPIIPDEARTFGMDSLFRQVGIYSSVGQKYDPVDSDSFLYYKESKQGQILEEGINEAGAMSSFIAAGTSHVAHDEYMIPFYTYYSMFGFQRVGDLIWAAADCRAKGFLLGATAGRTTLNGEGLQHEDGHSLVAAMTVPNLMSYDPTYAYEIAVIVRDGLYRMYEKGEDIFYYLTLENQNYMMPAMPEGSEEGILRGMYRLKSSECQKDQKKIHLLGSGAIMESVLKAKTILEQDFNLSVDIWSVTSYNELRKDALEAERWNRLHPKEEPRVSYLEHVLKDEEGVFIAASDYMKILSEGISQWVPGGLVSLGTDGFGRSESRENLRRFFEVDAECIVTATLYELSKRGEMSTDDVQQAIETLGIDADKPNPLTV